MPAGVKTLFAFKRGYRATGVADRGRGQEGGQREGGGGSVSIPGCGGRITRSEWVKVKGRDREGHQVLLKADELMAQALEHEIDHLDGILYLDRMKEQGTLDTLTEIEAGEAAEVSAG